MAFKNALKMLISKFGLMWIVLLYLFITFVLVVSLSLPFAFPLVRTFREAGVGKLLYAFVDSVKSGAGTDQWFDDLYAVVRLIKDSIISNKSAAFNTGALVVVVFTFGYRFIFGLYELPLLSVIEGFMSSNARMGFVGRYIARIGKSARFTLVKMIYTILFDTLIYTAVYLLFVLFNVPVLKFFAPFLIMLVVLIMLAFRYSFIAMWAPHIAVEDGNIFRAFGFSMKKGTRNFGSIFSSFLMAWTIIIALNMLVGFFTFGAGLILTVPLSVLFVNLLNMTVYYGKNGKRYYVDSTTVVTPPNLAAEDKQD